MSFRELGGGWKGALKAIGWSVAFGVEGLVLGLAAAVGIGALIQGETNADWFSTPGLWQALAQGAGLSIGFGVATYHVGHRLLGRTWEDLRWRVPVPPGGWFARGLGLGAVAAGGAMLLGLVAAGADWSSDTGSIFDWARSASLTAGALALPALSEELIFRGVPLILLAGVLGRWPAVVLTSVAFGFSHWSNPEITALGMVNISLAGVLLGTAFFAPGGIWTAWGAHLGWNLALAGLGAPVSGLPLSMPFIEYDPGGPAWLWGAPSVPRAGCSPR